jgi:hypothetical protein
MEVSVKIPGCVVGTFSEHTYVGQPLKSEKYDEADTIRITGDNPNVKVRVIPMKWITAIDGTPYEYKGKPEKKTVQVPSSKPGKFYTVVIEGGSAICDCPAYTYRGGNCKHLVMAKEM